MNQEMPIVGYYSRTSNLVQDFSTDNQALNENRQLWETQQARQAQKAFLRAFEPQQQQPNQESEFPMANRRIVQVIIADTNDNVPLNDCVLYKGPEKLTDATDQELFFETNISEVLTTYNAKRVKCLDKEATKRSGRDVFLDPVKIRELKMVVVTVAQL